MNANTTLTTTTTTTKQEPEALPPAHAGGDPKRGRHWWVWLLVLLAVSVGAYYHFAKKPAASVDSPKAAGGASAPRAVPIVEATATKGDIGVYINALGTVTAVYTVTVTSRVDGQITSVLYHEGQMVHKGDLLIEIDPRPYEAQLMQAEGQLAHDQALLNEARIDLERYKAALARNAIAKQQVDDQEQVVAQYEGTVKNDQGQIDSAKTQVDYTRITSPIDGRVGLRLVDPGNIVHAADTTGLVVITQLQPITVIFSVAEDYLPQIQKQMSQGHTMAVDAFARDQQTKLATGSLLTMDNQVDTTTGTVKLKAIFPNKDLALFPNAFVNARLLVDTQHGATLVPTAAIQRNAQGPFVYVVKTDQTVSMRPVTVGTSDGNIVAVQGISPGDVVAVNGFDKLQDGAKVTQRQAGGNAQGAKAR
jgi:membrane fusion protein, multidrug efflux system